MTNKVMVIIIVNFQQQRPTVTLSWPNGYIITKVTYKPSRPGQTDLVLVYDQSSAVVRCLHGYNIHL